MVIPSLDLLSLSWNMRRFVSSTV